jgi:hypothetical protein
MNVITTGLYCTVAYYTVKICSFLKNKTLSENMRGLTSTVKSVISAPQNFYNTFVYWKDSIKDVHTLSNRLEPNKFFAVIKTTQVMTSYIIRDIGQKLNNNIRYLSDGRIIMCYIFEGKEYCIPINKSRSPCILMCATNQDGKDVTDDILKYYGPGYDFHGLENSVSPSLFGHNSLKIEFLGGEIYLSSHNNKLFNTVPVPQSTDVAEYSSTTP